MKLRLPVCCSSPAMRPGSYAFLFIWRTIALQCSVGSAIQQCESAISIAGGNRSLRRGTREAPRQPCAPETSRGLEQPRSQGPWDPDSLCPALSLGGQATAWECSPGRSLCLFYGGGSKPWVHSNCAGDLRELLRVPLRSQGYCGAGTRLSGRGEAKDSALLPSRDAAPAEGEGHEGFPPPPTKTSRVLLQRVSRP